MSLQTRQVSLLWKTLELMVIHCRGDDVIQSWQASFCPKRVYWGLNPNHFSSALNTPYFTQIQVNKRAAGFFRIKITITFTFLNRFQSILYSYSRNVNLTLNVFFWNTLKHHVAQKPSYKNNNRNRLRNSDSELFKGRGVLKTTP